MATATKITCELRDYASKIIVEKNVDITVLPVKTTGVYMLIDDTASTAEIASLLNNINSKIVNPQS